MDSDGDPHPHTPNPAEEKARKKSIKRARKRELQKLKLQQGPSELHKEDPQISPPGALLQTLALRLAAFLKIKQAPSELHKEGRPETSGPAIGEQAGSPAPEGARVRQSVLYSGRPRRSTTDKKPVEDNAGKVSGSEGPTVTDLPEFKVLALNEGHPKPELTDSSKEGDTANSETESEVVVEEEPKDESDCDSEEEWCKFREYKKRMLDKDFAPQSATQAAASDKNSAVENVTEYSGVAEWADRSYLTWQKSLLVCSEAQHTMVAPSSDEPPSEVSDEDIIQNGEKWMSDEVMVAFNEYIETTDKLRELEYCFEKLCHQCFNVECYFKIFHHFNFTVKTKHPSSDDWKSITYFAELKEIFGEKYYFCCPLESSENGRCYACRNQGVYDLMHPATGGFERGLPGTVFPYM
ncbi:uncharacterized protein LOC124703003 isoform X1 [Lolium rigidum]|uniref:uncharacterized protein LOC124703003 isoform X1 n=2 Tax=Lolium rigidum TaxID=89674 RepID=UPI001F5D2719|nr:uncharacterized protein LOC124703003 isoform X1 [Lolium rigidum]